MGFRITLHLNYLSLNNTVFKTNFQWPNLSLTVNLPVSTISMIDWLSLFSERQHCSTSISVIKQRAESDTATIAIIIGADNSYKE